jgi:dephospho-CoA kinase
VIVDADKITRELQEPGQPVLLAMAERFGPGIIDEDGALRRQVVADIVFNDKAALDDLTAITRPAIAEEMYARARKLLGTDEIVVFDIALLIEGGGYQVDGIIVVDTPVDVAVERLVAQRGMSEEDARARIGNQLSREERLAAADFVLDNGADEAHLVGQLDDLWSWVGTLPDKTVI